MIERKDLRIKLDADDHAGLFVLADAEDLELSAWAERVLVREIRRRIHAATIIAEKAKRTGIAGRPIPTLTGDL